MPKKLVNRVIRIIEDQAKNAGAYPDFVRFMRLALLSDPSSVTDSKYSQLVSLPDLCCQITGGQQKLADYLTASWLSFYQAAHLMDSVQDQDEPDPWWGDKGPSLALNVASGLYFTASLILQKLRYLKLADDVTQDIINEFYRSFSIMNNGQFFELTHTDLSLEQYWENARAKSGAFFALACWSGARLGTQDSTLLNNFRVLGENLGILIQVKDDLEEVMPPPDTGVAGQRPKLRGSLPVIYAFDVLASEKNVQLALALEYASTQQEAAGEVIQLLDQCGATTYVRMEIDRHRHRALGALNHIDPEGAVKDSFYKLIISL